MAWILNLLYKIFRGKSQRLTKIDSVILTYKIKHGRDFSNELILARKVAEYALLYGSISTKHVKHFGLKSAISCQILRKYSRNRKLKKVGRVKLTIPGQAIKVKNNQIYISCVKLCLDILFDRNFSKINQIELDDIYAYISVTYPDAPKINATNIVGVDRNMTRHVIVASCPETGKVIKLGKNCNHIHQKYKNTRRNLQKRGKNKKAKSIRNRESRIVRDINHKTTKALVLFAKENNACLVLEDLKEITKTAKTRKKGKYSLNSWSFYQQKMMIEYKAKKYGIQVFYVEPQYTSQRCSRCGHIEQANRKGNLFQCKQCGIVEDSGVNAGFNIAQLHKSGMPRFVKDRDLTKGSTDTPKEATA